MNSRNQIKTHFDNNIIIFFLFFFIFSCGLLAFKSSKEEKCLVSEFNVEVNSFEEGATLVFSDSSKESYSWSWYFGDGTDMEYKSKVKHIFRKAGDYKVKLLINNSCSLEKTIKIKKSNKLEIKPVVESKIIVSFTHPEKVFKDEKIQFFDKTANAVSWQWKFDENESIGSKVKNPTYTYKTTGLKTVTLIVNGDKKYTLSKVVNVIEQNAPVETRPARPARPSAVSAPVAVEPVVKDDKKLITEGEIGELIYIISKGKLTYESFKNNFCKDQLPSVQINSKSAMSLKDFYDLVGTKRMKIKSIKIKRETNTCVSSIYIKV
ncbi:PKD domain-containing protein [Flavobacterium ardleyense]|uniref:PKD domain-containing protein n=1 Tax=Flavobacterium ardleyense TaxID=2038737 RepID=A0ABW5ZCL6_9FLAO